MISETDRIEGFGEVGKIIIVTTERFMAFTISSRIA